MKSVYTKILLAGILLLMQACGAPATEPPPATEAVVSPPTDIPVPTQIQHTVVPAGLPAETSSVAADQDSSRTSADNSAGGGDRFTYGEYERPFNAATMDTYFPHLDISQYDIREDDTWIYATIVVRSRSSDSGLTGQYALEIDNDIDGRGNWLILVLSPASTEWTTNGVQVWQDANKDVGGTQPVNADPNPGFMDGYESKVFENGTGSDADAAWVRTSPDNPNAIQIAVKRTLVDDDGKYLAGTWAGSKLDPLMFDFNDRMTQEEAGAAVKSFSYYPIQGLAEMDNACRVSIGIVLSADNLGLCKVVAPQPAQGDPGQPGQPGGCTLTQAICESQGYCSVDLGSCQCVVCG